MNIKNAIIAALLVLTLGFGIGFGYYYKIAVKEEGVNKNISSLKKEISQLKKDKKKQKAQSDKEVTELKRNLAKPVKAKVQSNNESIKEVVSDSGKMIVSNPMGNRLINNPVYVSGNANVFEGTVNIKIKDANGVVIKEATTNTDASGIGKFGPFSVSVNYNAPPTPTGTIEVFEYSSRDGSEINKAVVPVRFTN